MAADGSIIIDTKIDDSGVPKQLSKMKTSLAQAAKTLALPIAITAGAIAAVRKVVGYMGELNKIYMVQASAERALSQAAANNPYLTGESVNNLKRYASELQKVSNYGDEVTIGLMTQLAAAGRTESEIQSIIKASADLAASGTTTFDGAVKNLNKTYSGLSGELGEVIPELKTLTAEQMKNGEAVDLIAKKYDGMAASVVDKSVQIQNALGDLKEGIGEIGASTGLTDIFQNSLLAITEWYTSGIRMFNDWVSRMRGTKDYEVDVLKQTLEERKNIVAKEKEIIKELYKEMEKDQDPTTLDYLDAEISKKWKLVSELEDGISMLYAEIEAKEKAIASTATKTSEEITEAEKKQIEGRIAAQEQYETAVKLATEKQKGGLITLEEKWEDIKKAAERYTDALIILGYTYDETGTKGGQALDEMRRKLTGVDLSAGLSPSVTGIKMPMGIFDTFVDNAAELGDDWGKQLTGSMASSIDNTSVGVSESIGAVMDNIGAAITIAIAVVKKIFAGIKAVAKFDPAAMYDSFLKIIGGLSKLFEKIGSLPIYIEAGKKVLFEFMRGMLENKEANMETFRNVLKYMIESAKEVLPAVISFAFIMMTDMATAIISQLPLIIETAFAIITAIAEGFLSALPDLIDSFISILPTLLTFFKTATPAFTANIISLIPEIITALLTAVIENLPAFASAILQGLLSTLLIMPAAIIASLILMLAEIFINILTPAEDGGKSIVTAMGEGFANSWEAFGDGIVELFGTLWERLLEVGEKGKEIGKALLEGIKKGIEDTWEKLLDIVGDVINSVIDRTKTLFGIHSPSTVFAGFGVNLMDGLKNAILGYDLWGKISGKFTELRGKVSNALSGIKDTASTVSTSVGDWFKGLFNAEGTNNFRGGTAIINEEGAELVTLPSGSKIMTASATAQMQDRAISQLLAGMKTPTFAVAGSGGSRNINISTKVDAPLMVDGSVLGRLVFQNIDRAVV